jgi:pantoate--beta-alanine ligase
VRAFEEGERRAEVLRREVLALVEPAADVVDYVAVADPDRVVPFEDGALVGERALVAIALKIGATRLIDNVVLGEEPAPIRS